MQQIWPFGNIYFVNSNETEALWSREEKMKMRKSLERFSKTINKMGYLLLHVDTFAMATNNVSLKLTLERAAFLQTRQYQQSFTKQHIRY